MDQEDAATRGSGPAGTTPPLTDDDVGPTDAASELDRSSSALYLNRELSELSFHHRVLHEALDDRNPLLERARFLGIFTSNLDEFFMKRVGGLKQQMTAGVTELSPDGRTPNEQWTAVLERSRDLFERQARCFHEEVRPALAEAGVRLCDYGSLTDAERRSLRAYFEETVLPTLTPLTFDPGNTFPFISNLSLSLAVLTRDEADGEVRFSRVKVPPNLPRTVPVGDGEDGEESRFVLLEDVVEGNLDLLFPNVEVLDASLFRVTRNAEVRRNEEVAEGLIDMIEEVLRQRRFATVVRLELEPDAPGRVWDVLTEHLDVAEAEVFEVPRPIDYTALAALGSLDRPSLKAPAWTPQPHPRLADHDAEDPSAPFAEIRSRDVLVHHPYHSFAGTVQTFLDAAATDADVLAIKLTIYRTAPDSNVVQSLIRAASEGKQVAVMVELTARFDEENNLRWVRRLEEEGIHVSYGTVGLKTHTKTALVVREEDDGVRLYSHVATGNYHSETAKVYTDLGLLTADRAVGRDLVKLFNFFTGHARHTDYEKLLVAPENLRSEFTRLVRREADHARAGRDARVVAKMNSLEDPEMVRELYEASRAGVDVDLVVRGVCRLRPGVEGLSENVAVSSVVGRFLEHSRIFYFENAGDPEYYIGSADWMTRNLDRRVEAVAPIEDPEHRSELDAVFEALFADDRRRWVMCSDGAYRQVCPPAGEGPTEAHELLMERARSAARREVDGE